MNYSIIQFEDGVEIVPNKWLVGEDMCYWPPINSDKSTLHKLVFSKASIEKNWVQYKVLKIFCQADTYDTGMQKLKLALEMSDIDTSDESLKRTRHSRHPKVADEFDESDVDHFIPSSIPNKKEKKRRPLLLDSDEDDIEASAEMSSKFPPFPSAANFTLVGSRKNNTAHGEVLQIRNSVPQQSMPLSRPSTPCSGTYSRVSNRGTDEILIKLNTLLSISKVIENRLTLIECSISSLQGNGSAKVPSSSSAIMEAKEFNKMFPLTNEEDLMRFEDELKDDTYSNKMIATLCTIGGTDVQSVTVNILKKLFSNSLANLFSLHGKKKKKIFKNLHTCNLIVDTVRKQKCGVTEVEVLAIIGSWLPQSNLRLAREQRKENKELEHHNNE